MRFLHGAKRETDDERLLWSRDIRFAHRLLLALPECRSYELDSGIVVIGPADDLTDSRAAEIAATVRSPAYCLVTLDPDMPEGERHLVALSAAVQQSGLAERIGMAQSSQMMQSKMLDYFFTLKNGHGLAYQPIVELTTGHLVEYECLFRPQMPGLQTSIGSVVQAAVDTGRTIELDGSSEKTIQATQFSLATFSQRALADAEDGLRLKALAIAFNAVPAEFVVPTALDFEVVADAS